MTGTSFNLIRHLPVDLGPNQMNFKSPCVSPSPHTDTMPQAFGIPLSQVISNDRTHKQRHDPPREENSDFMLSFFHFNSGFKRGNKELSSSNSSLSSTSETPNDSPVFSAPDAAPRTRRRVGLSCQITLAR